MTALPEGRAPNPQDCPPDVVKEQQASRPTRRGQAQLTGPDWSEPGRCAPKARKNRQIGGGAQREPSTLAPTARELRAWDGGAEYRWSMRRSVALFSLGCAGPLVVALTMPGRSHVFFGFALRRRGDCTDERASEQASTHGLKGSKLRAIARQSRAASRGVSSPPPRVNDSACAPRGSAARLRRSSERTDLRPLTDRSPAPTLRHGLPTRR